VKQLSAAQWRVLNYLFQHKLHTVRPKLIQVRKAQDVTDVDLRDLEARGLFTAYLVDEEYPLNRVPQPLVKYVRLRLNDAGLRAVIGDPGNQIRYSVGQYYRQYSEPIGLNKLCVNGDIAIDDVVAVFRLGQIKASLCVPDFGDFELDGKILWLFAENDAYGNFFKVTLTPKGREYLPL